MDWHAFVFDPDTQWMTRLRRLAEKRFQGGGETLVEEAFTWCFERSDARPTGLRAPSAQP